MQLAEVLQAQVIDQGGRMNFPKTHYLSRPLTARQQCRRHHRPGADRLLGHRERLDRQRRARQRRQHGQDKPETKLISISSVDLNTKANYQDFQRFQVVDVHMAADAETTLPSLIEAVKAAIPNDRKAAIEKRGEAAKKAYADAHDAQPGRRRRSPSMRARSAPRAW